MREDYPEIDNEECEKIVEEIPKLFEEQAENLSAGQLKILHSILDDNMEPKTEYFKELLTEYNLGDSIVETVIEILDDNEMVVLM